MPKITVKHTTAMGRWIDGLQRCIRDVEDAIEADNLDEVLKVAIDAKSYADMLKHEAIRIQQEMSRT